MASFPRTEPTRIRPPYVPPVSLELDELLDVVIASPADGDAVTYDAASGMWVNSAVSGGSGTPASTVVTETAFGQASAVGVSGNYARADHTHGTPAAPTAASVGADPAGTAASAIAAHEADPDPHPDYTTSAELSSALASYQPLDADLTAIAALATTGWAKRTGANTWTLSTPTAADVGADPTGTAASAVAAHEAALDPHPVYTTSSELTTALASYSLSSHTHSHTDLTDLSWHASAHIGASDNLAGFDGSGNPTYYDPTSFATAGHDHTGVYEPVIAAGLNTQYWRGDKTWQTLDKTAVGLSNVENTALSTWTGSTNITTLGTIATGTWQGTAIASAYIGAHAAKHKNGGSDEILLHELGEPTSSVDFNGQQATNFRVENRTSDPGSPAVGQIWLRTDL